MKSYLIIVAGCTTPELRPVKDRETALKRHCQLVKVGEINPDYDCSFFAKVNEAGELELSVFTGGEVEEMAESMGH